VAGGQQLQVDLVVVVVVGAGVGAAVGGVAVALERPPAVPPPRPSEGTKVKTLPPSASVCRLTATSPWRPPSACA
jgi:hypothetical protein